MNFNRLVKILILSMLVFSGCNATQFLVAPIVTGVTYWVNGEAHRYYHQDKEVLYRATKNALKKLDLPISKDASKNESYHIIAGEKNRFSIQVEQSEKEIAKLSIRINIMGDKDLANLIYQNVDETLNTIEFKDGKVD